VSDDPVHASVVGPHWTPATEPGAVVGTDETPPTDPGVVVGDVTVVTVVGGALVVVVAHFTGSPTVAVTVLVNSSVHVATTVITIEPVTPPGTTVVAFVVAPPGTGFVTTETSYEAPEAAEVALTLIAFFARSFVMVHVTRCEPSEHDVTPVTMAVCAPAGTAIASDAATIATQLKHFASLMRPLLPWSLEAASVNARGARYREPRRRERFGSSGGSSGDGDAVFPDRAAPVGRRPPSLNFSR
jgi:hypothetical protein